MSDSRVRRPRWVVALVGLVAAGELAAAAVLFGHDPGAGPPRPRATGTVTRPRNDTTAHAAAHRAAAVTALLDRRAAAIRARDRAAFAATLDPAQVGFVRSQLAVFDALADVPLASWRYTLAPDDDVALAPALLDRYGAEVWAPAATLHFQLRGFDDRPTAVRQFFTFVHRGDRWLVASDTDTATDTDRRTARDLWDFGRVTVVPGRRALVLGHPADRTLLRHVARLADAAVPRVSAVWGEQWAQRAVVLVPSTQGELHAILGDDTDLSRIAAVAVAALGDGEPANSPVGNRVLVNPQNFTRLGDNGRRVVLTHEITHVATRDASPPGTPTWLVEGFADYVGYLGTGLSARAICQELAAEVKAGRRPTQLPRDAEFAGSNPRLAQVYEASWLAVRLIVERVGRDGLVAFYRALAKDSDVRRVMNATLRTTPETFTEAWRAYVVEQLG